MIVLNIDPLSFIIGVAVVVGMMVVYDWYKIRKEKEAKQ